MQKLILLLIISVTTMLALLHTAFTKALNSAHTGGEDITAGVLTDSIPPLGLEDLKQLLVGEWTSTAWDGWLEESWRIDSTGRLLQEQRYLEDGYELYSAVSTIDEIDGKLVLISLVKGGGAKIFQAAYRGSHRIDFTNKDYQNPNSVSYRFDQENRYSRIISGIENNLPSVQTFRFRRQGLLPRALIFSDYSIKEVKVSPDGKLVAYTKGVPGTSELWLREIASRKEIKLDSAKHYFSHVFTSSGNLLLLHRKRPALSLISPEGGERKTVEIDLAYSAAGVLAVSAEIPSEVVCFFQVEGAYHLYRLNVLTGKVRHLEKAEHFQYFFAADLQAAAAIGRNQQGGVTFYRRVADRWLAFREHEWDEGLLLGSSLNNILSVSKEGDTIYHLSHLNADKVQYLRTYRKTGQTELILPAENYDLTHKERFIGPRGQPIALAQYPATLDWHLIDSTYSKDFTRLREAELGSFSLLGMSEDTEQWLLRTFNGGPARYYSYLPTSGKVIPIFSERPDLVGRSIAIRGHGTYPTRDGLSFAFHLYLPAGTKTDAKGRPLDALPMVVYVHGGPWVGFQWNSWYSNRNFQLLADRGYAVLVPDFRGSLGYGKASIAKSAKQWGKAMHQDILDAVDWAANEGFAEPGKIGIYGWSYGGYETMWALGASPEVFKCGMALFGISDLNTFLESEMGEQALWQVGVGDRRKDSVALAEVSPITNVANYRAPILMSTGLKDRLVPPTQMEEMANALYKNSKHLTYFTLADEGHDYQAPESHQSFWALAEPFLQKHLGGKVEPVGNDLKNKELRVVYKISPK